MSISKRGDVIPAVENVIEKNEQGNTTWQMPEKCPVCGSVLEKRGAHHFCPNYDWEPQPNETDYRRTVYWNPQATTDPEGRVHLEFFNNGFSERLAVSAEGITANGQPITTRP